MSRKSRILIVDDEPFNIDYLEQELEDLGYDTVSAVSGVEALEKVADEAPDLILLDVMMPGIDGFTVCRMLKENRNTRLIPVVIMTSLNATEDRIKGIEAGADDFLSKPVNERELIARIKTGLKFKHAVDDEIDELRQVRDHLVKFVPDTVKRLVAANPAAPELHKREQDVSVLFLDISGYARLSEKLSPEVLNGLVERYFSAFLDCIHDNDGEISETTGDGLMAIFQDGDSNRHAVKAVEAAVRLFGANEALNAENSVQPIAIHIGVNTGPALVGSTKYQGRRGVRWVFTADGHVINLAARLGGIAKEGEIIVGPETVNRLGDRYAIEKLGHEHLKNISKPVDIFRVLGPRSAKRTSRRGAVRKAEVEPGVERKLATVLAADIGNGSGKMDGLLAAHYGRALKADGDRLLAEFGSPLAAVRCALDIRHQAKERPPCIGIGIGFIVVKKNKVGGDGVTLAVRLMEQADPGDICAADTVRENVGKDMADMFEEIGEKELEGLTRAVRMFRLVEPDAAAPSPATQKPDVDQAVEDLPAEKGMPWPGAYRDFKTHIVESWRLTDDIYLDRALSGKSGAQVYAVDVTSPNFSGQAILKLDHVRDPSWSEEEEAERHRQAVTTSPDFAAKHLPEIVDTCEHEGQIAILSTIAGRGLEYARPWAECAYDQQLASAQMLSRELLEDWNGDYKFAAGMRRPSELLKSWLGYRLDPSEGRIHAFLADTCDIASDAPTFMLEGRWYPNPVAFAQAAHPLPDQTKLRAATGHMHGDLHGFNVLATASKTAEPTYYMIDLALYKETEYLFYDHAYFELSYLMHVRDGATVARWKSILEALGGPARAATESALSGDDLGLVRLLLAVRKEQADWMESHEPNRLPYLESQDMLARIAAGLNYVNKPMAANARCMGLLYAANNLKHYLKFHAIDWPKKGPVLNLADLET